ncbi:MAG: beta-galactosidase [Mangrovibacterium sp.]
MRYLFILLAICISANAANAQPLGVVAVSNGELEIKSGILRMGNPGPEGKEIRVNNRYLTLGGNPVIPVMGEIHFSRVPREQWEDVILKMKACGINIVATYVLWIHHEEIEGQFDWTGNKDLRAFAGLCAKHGLWFYPRIGPWCHAEVRNGGTPDWILTKRNLKDRSNDPVYQHYAENWYKQVALQLEGLMYKDGGPVIGIQLENEYRHGETGEKHILWLKETARKYGLDVPLYTVTGWQNGSVPPHEVVPLWGAYPDEPWADHLKRNTDCSDYRFTPYRDFVYPFFTCEVGVGIMNTDHRRLRIGPKDGLGLIMAKIGSGSNLPGYYMFAGGSNPTGILTSMEENKDETGYWNTNPVISYDFQAAIRESGRLNGCYYQVKKLHYFLNEFGNRLAPMVPAFPSEPGALQYVFRTDKKAAFLFGMNYCRHNPATAKQNIQFAVKLDKERIIFPSKPLTIADSAMFIWPVNFDLNGIPLQYATAQPLCKLDSRWIFIEDADSMPEFCFPAKKIETITASTGRVTKQDGKYLVSELKPGKDCVINVKSQSCPEQKIIVLSKQEALQSWLLNGKSGKQFFLSRAGMYSKGDTVFAFGTNNELLVSQLNTDENAKSAFSGYQIKVPGKNIRVEIRKTVPLADAAWLKTGDTEKLDNQNALLHRFFLKEFSLNNPSEIKQAQLLLYGESACRLQLNNRWVNSPVESGKLNRIDLTGYTQKGDNRLIIDFPFQAGLKTFAARLVITYFNSDRLVFGTDRSWLCKDAYNYPSYLTGFNGFEAPEIVESKPIPAMHELSKQEYVLSFPNDFADRANNVYLQLDYTGDKGRLYFNHHLVADDFYSGATWEIGLNRLHLPLEIQPLQLVLKALPADAPVYFDDKNAQVAAQKAELIQVKAVPEYSVKLINHEGKLIRLNE